MIVSWSKEVSETSSAKVMRSWFLLHAISLATRKDGDTLVAAVRETDTLDIKLVVNGIELPALEVLDELDSQFRSATVEAAKELMLGKVEGVYDAIASFRGDMDHKIDEFLETLK